MGELVKFRPAEQRVTDETHIFLRADLPVGSIVFCAGCGTILPPGPMFVRMPPCTPEDPRDQ